MPSQLLSPQDLAVCIAMLSLFPLSLFLFFSGHFFFALGCSALQLAVLIPPLRMLLRFCRNHWHLSEPVAGLILFAAYGVICLITNTLGIRLPLQF